MQRVSSNLTLFFKMFLPTMWIVFFGTFGLAIFVTDSSQIPLLTSATFKYSFLIFYLLFFVILYYTLIPLKRVEMGKEYYIVSDYFKSYKLIYHDIADFSEISLGRLKYIIFTLKSKGTLGRKIPFLASSFLWNHFLENNPDIAELIIHKKQ